MVAREVCHGIFWVGAIDWDRRLFDELIPLPNGTSYNSYLIKGSEKTALIDTVDPTKREEFFGNLLRLGVNQIDYIIVNHAEQDHSGCLPEVLECFPSAKVFASEKCVELLGHLLEIPKDRCHVVKDQETLSLGDRTLEFYMTPWTHWPETMITFLIEDKILFPCDLFGSHYATSDLFMRDERAIYLSAKRYYAEIMMPFRSKIKDYVTKARSMDIDLIAPSHGPIYKAPSFILDAYADWTSDTVKNEVVIPYISMHGSTLNMVEYFTNALIARGITVKPFNLSKTDIGELAMSLVDAATIVIATPTVLFGPHPQVLYTADLANLLKPKVRFASVIGSFGGWGGKAEDTIVKRLNNLKVELLDPVLVKGLPLVRGLPEQAGLKDLDRLADDILKKHKEINIV